MTSPPRPSNYRFWLISLAAFCVAVWVLKPMLLPFLIGLAIAYFLDPVVDVLMRLRMPRWLACVMVLLGFALAVTLILLMIVPLLETQIIALIQSMPAYIQTAREHLTPLANGLMTSLSPDELDKLRQAGSQLAGNAVSFVGRLLKDVISGGFALFDILALFIITPVVAFYMLRDWPKLTEAIDKLLPRQHYEVIRNELQEIDLTLSGFIRGQALVCLCLGTLYSVGLTLVGLKYGATIGIIAGILSFIPYVGTAFGWCSSLALAFVQFDSGLEIGMVAAVFALGHVMEGYVLTPKLVGDRVGLHPVWILFALFAGGTIMGFTGVLIAIPTAAVIGVLTRFALGKYKASGFYGGTDGI